MRTLAALLFVTVGVASGAPLAMAQFDLEESHTTASLRGIDAVGPGVAWASGSGGTVRRTEDGGFLWQFCTIPPGADKLDFRAVQGFDANTALVMSSGKGALSRVFKTTDGCQTWKEVFVNPDAEGFFDAMVFSDSKNGMILGDPVHGGFALFASMDAGATWKRQDAATSDAEEGAFAASNSSLYLGAAGFRSLFGSGGPRGARVFAASQEPAGKWNPQAMPMFAQGAGAGVFSIAGGAGQSVVAVGGDYTLPMERRGTAAFSSDAGKTWSAARVPPGGYRSAVAYDARHKAWLAVGPGGTDVSFDDGRTWRAVTGPAAAGWNAISLPFVVGAKGQIGKVREEVWAR